MLVKKERKKKKKKKKKKEKRYKINLVVSKPAKAHQSFTTRPPPMTGLPLLIVPATKGTCKSVESSS